MFECQRCGGVGETVTMAGGRRVTVCEDCGSKFHAWLVMQEVFRERRALEVIRTCLDGLCTAGQQVPEFKWAEYFVRRHANNDELFRVTGLWLEKHKAKREEPVATSPDPVPFGQPPKPIQDGGVELNLKPIPSVYCKGD